MSKSRQGDDLWALALKKLTDDERQAIDYLNSDKVVTVSKLLQEVRNAEGQCKAKQWRYKRKDGKGESIILRDVFRKIVKWVERFKEIGDKIVQYDPVHAALPWAGVRFLIEVAVGDIENFGFLTEGAEVIAITIDRCIILENVYIRSSPTVAIDRFRGALTALYATILKYLAKTKHYFETKSGVRVLKSIVESRTKLESYLNEVKSAQALVNEYAGLLDTELAIESANGIVRLAVDQDEIRKALILILQDLDGPINRMSDQVKDIEDHLNATARLDLLDRMSEQPYIAHHTQNKRDILPGTGQWLFEDPCFVQWEKSSASSLLWLRGSSGTGKTKLLAIVIDSFKRQHALGQIMPPIFFYCSRNTQESSRSDPEAILACLARQLSNLEPDKPVHPPTLQLYTGRRKDGFASGRLVLEESIALIAQLTEYYPITIMVIDALDECNAETRYLLLDAFEHLLKHSKGLIKILASSREDGDLVCELREYPSLTISSDKNSKDIEAFVKSEIERLVSKKRLLRHCSESTKVELQVQIQDTLIMRAQGKFRWVCMSLEALCAMHVDSDVKSQLGRIPQSLIPLYSDIYKRLFERTGETGRMLIMNAFRWLLCVQTPLKSGEFLAAICQNLAPSPDTLSKAALLDLCGDFITLDETLDTFRFAHSSVQEFLEDRPHYESSLNHALAAECCLVYLINRAHTPAARNILSQRYLGTKNKRTSIRRTTYAHAFGFYATRYAMQHCKQANLARESEPLRSVLDVFLSDDNAKESPLHLWIKLVPRTAPTWELVRQGIFASSSYLREDRNSYYRPFAVACLFDFQEIIDRYLTLSFVSVKEQAVIFASPAFDFGVLKNLLDGETRKISSLKTLSVTLKDVEPQNSEKIVQWAAAYSDHFVAILKPTLSVSIPTTVTKLALENNDLDALDILLRLDHWNMDVLMQNSMRCCVGREEHQFYDALQHPDRIPPSFWKILEYDESLILPDTLASFVLRSSVEPKLFIKLAKHIKPTEDLLDVAVRHPKYGLDRFTHLISRCPDLMTISLAICIFQSSLEPAVFQELAKRIKLTEELLVVAMSHPVYGADRFTHLISRHPELMTTSLANFVLQSSLGSHAFPKIAKYIKTTEELLVVALKDPIHGLDRFTQLLENRPDLTVTSRILCKIAAPHEKAIDVIWKHCSSETAKRELILDAMSNPHALDRNIIWLLMSKYDNFDMRRRIALIAEARTDAANNRHKPHHAIAWGLLSRYNKCDIRDLILLVDRYSRNMGDSRDYSEYMALGFENGRIPVVVHDEIILEWFVKRVTIRERPSIQISIESDKRDHFTTRDERELQLMIDNINESHITEALLEETARDCHPIFFHVLLQYRKNVEITEAILIAAICNRWNSAWMTKLVLNRAKGLRITEAGLKSCFMARPIRAVQAFCVILDWDPAVYVPGEGTSVARSRGSLPRGLQSLLSQHENTVIGLAAFGL